MKYAHKEDMIQLKEKGFSFDEISTILDCDEKLVKNMIRVHASHLMRSGGNQTRYEKIDLPVNEIIHFRKQGWGKNQIASCYGVSPATIKNRIREWSEENNTDLSGFIPQTLKYPGEAIDRLKSKGYTLWSLANEDENTSVVDIVRKLNLKSF